MKCARKAHVTDERDNRKPRQRKLWKSCFQCQPGLARASWDDVGEQIVGNNQGAEREYLLELDCNVGELSTGVLYQHPVCTSQPSFIVTLACQSPLVTDHSLLLPTSEHGVAPGQEGTILFTHEYET